MVKPLHECSSHLKKAACAKKKKRNKGCFPRFQKQLESQGEITAPAQPRASTSGSPRGSSAMRPTSSAPRRFHLTGAGSAGTAQPKMRQQRNNNYSLGYV